jgi:hypothetical protein
MADARRNDPDSRLTLVLFRTSVLLDQAQFARAARIAPSQLSAWAP